MKLLHQITRSIGERQDLRSIFQVVIRSLEDQLPVDFGAICLYRTASWWSAASACAAMNCRWRWP
jgi:nitrate/nitrite-specific signal transduction histidine kinase